MNALNEGKKKDNDYPYWLAKCRPDYITPRHLKSFTGVDAHGRVVGINKIDLFALVAQPSVEPAQHNLFY